MLYMQLCGAIVPVLQEMRDKPNMHFANYEFMELVLSKLNVKFDFMNDMVKYYNQFMFL